MNTTDEQYDQVRKKRRKIEKVNFGIVGLGGRAENIAGIVIKLPEANLIHLCDIKQSVIDSFKKKLPRSEHQTATMKETTDYDEMLNNNEIEAIIVTVPDGLHERMAVKAFEAGKHVFLEKPVGTNLEENRNILNAAIDSGKLFQVGYQMRYHPFYQAVKKLVDQEEDGPLGRVNYVEANEHYYGGYHYFRSWWRFRENIGGVMIQKICHDLEFLYWLFGVPTRISCFGSNIEFKKGNAPKGSTAKLCRNCPKDQRCEYHIANDDTSSFKSDQCVYNADHDIIDNSQTLIQFENGLVVKLGMHFFPSKAQNSRFLKIAGSKAELWGKVKENVIRINPRFDRSVNQNESFMYSIPRPEIRIGTHLIKDFVNGIKTNTPVEPGLKSGYWSTLMVTAAQMSLEEKRTVEISEIQERYPFPTRE